MSSRSDPSIEMERLFQLECGDPKEISIRVLGILAGSYLLFEYTGWPSAWLWLSVYLLSQSAYFIFLKQRKATATAKDEVVAAVLFLVLLASFLWMPAMMICEQDRALSISGAALIGCILVFLVRRSDTSKIMVIGEVVIVAITILYVFLTIMPQFENIFARLGVFCSGLALLYYFAEAARVSRKLRLETAEANLRSLQAEKMAAIGQLAGGVAHDFNNNLTAIMGHLELLALIDDPAERQSFLEEASVAARQAAKTVKQLLAFARKERMVLAPQDSNEILDGLLALTRRLIPTSVNINIDPCPEPQAFMADRAQLLSALINLVVNAIDAMPNGGELTLSSRSIQQKSTIQLADGSSLGTGNYVRITVTDTGTGIPEHLLTKVLEPFFTTKPTGKGTGLGLPMAMGVSKEFGGGLTILTSARGTKVSIYLPTL